MIVELHQVWASLCLLTGSSRSGNSGIGVHINLICLIISSPSPSKSVVFSGTKKLHNESVGQRLRDSHLVFLVD